MSVGAVMELVGNRRAECVKMESHGEMTHMEFTIPARSLIGIGTRHLSRDKAHQHARRRFR